MTYREPRNTLYVGATLSQEIRDAVSGIVPTNLGEGPANGTVKISSVMDLASETYRLIDGLNEFRMVGIDLTVPDGGDESLALVASDGATKVADITVVSTEDGQRIICTLASAVPAGTYYVRIVSHGLDPTAPLVTALHKVSVKAAVVPPAPDPTPVVSSVASAMAGVMPGYIVKGENIVINGRNFGDSVSDLSVALSRAGETLAVGDIRVATDSRIEIAWPEDFYALMAGDEVDVTVTRTIDGEPHVSSKATAYIFAD